jgi:exoribonuclease R
VALRRVRAPHIGFGALRRELKLPDGFPAAVSDEAERSAADPPRPLVDRTDVPFATIDPATSLDLDQAMCLQRRSGGGYRVYYAIADVASWVRPGGAVDVEAWGRGQTVYLPDGKVPLHPKVLSEDAASLLPDRDRPAVVWTIDLDSDGGTVDVRVERALVRSRAKLDYERVQSDVDAGQAAEPVTLLPEIGKLLIERGLGRGAINLPIPDQQVERDGDGDGWRLRLRAPLAVEEYNAQISLLTGATAAKIMIDGRIGLLRTMPAPQPEAVARLRAAAPALGVLWPEGVQVGAVIATLDPADPRAAAFLDQAVELMRGAGYRAFEGQAPADAGHGAVAAPYAHVTAPLRRLADRYATEVCLALHSGVEVPEWVRQALPKLPAVMSSTDRIAGTAERGAVDLVEAVLLQQRVGEVFEAAVLDVDPGVVALDEPAVQARCEGDGLVAGTRVRVRLVEADPSRRKVVFQRVRDSAGDAEA